MPFTKVVRNAPIDRSVPPPITVGEHVRTVRCERKLTQTQAAEAMGVTETTVLNWEKGDTEPAIQYWPLIIKFLGYDPLPVGQEITDRMRAFRRHRGLTIKLAANRAGVDPDSWAEWERTGRVGRPKQRAALEQFLNSS